MRIDKKHSKDSQRKGVILLSRRFQRRIENFVCEHCNEKVTGDGYTDHCPRCLWSKHVDTNPGDRKAGCRGLMEPIEIEPHRNGYRILYRCLRCGYTHRNKTSDQDDFSAILAISKKTGGGQIGKA
jgi:hypothetical protein